MGKGELYSEFPKRIYNSIKESNIKIKDYNIIPWNELVYYDETSPTFIRWKVENRRGRNKHIVINKIGDVAGSIGAKGYCQIQYKGSDYKIHRIIWILFNSEIPNDMYIDHIDGNTSNNSILNIRLVTPSINCRNRPIKKGNNTGISGVVYDSCKNRYIVSWVDEEGKKRSKSFALRVYGNRALACAIEYKLGIFEYLNKLGCGYTNRHIGIE